MTHPGEAHRYCGRDFTTSELGQIRALIAEHPDFNRAELSRQVCDLIGWHRHDGRRKDMSCRVAMLRMESDGWFQLPAPQSRNGNGRRQPRITAASAPRFPVTAPAGKLGELEFSLVVGRQESFLWNELIQRYHYLGYAPMGGAQLRYFVSSGHHLLAALGFGAAAWKVQPRDQFIGWSTEARERNLHFVVNNARYLILPWVTSK
ncbi:MAG: DUF4338 domain-containing protein, partial [Planctomycetota bacterium]|nr:DUF4338 domain-containing protein [Planctomycetota bacterium]